MAVVDEVNEINKLANAAKLEKDLNRRRNGHPKVEDRDGFVAQKPSVNGSGKLPDHVEELSDHIEEYDEFVAQKPYTNGNGKLPDEVKDYEKFVARTPSTNGVNGQSAKAAAREDRRDETGEVLWDEKLDLDKAPASSYEIMSHIYVWKDTGYYPSKEQLEDKIICIEYVPAERTDLLGWVEKVSDLSFKKKVKLDAVMVFADYDKLTGKEISILIDDFEDAGALFTDYPTGSKGFNNAMELYDDRIGYLENMSRDYDAAREKLLSGGL